MAHPTTPAPNLRPRLALAALVVQALVLLLHTLDVDSPVRVLIGTAYVLVVPGWALVGLLDLRSPAFEWPLAVATSMAVGILLAQGLVWSGRWSPLTALLLLAAGTTPALVHQLVRPRGSDPAAAAASAHVG